MNTNPADTNFTDFHRLNSGQFVRFVWIRVLPSALVLDAAEGALLKARCALQPGVGFLHFSLSIFQPEHELTEFAPFRVELGIAEGVVPQKLAADSVLPLENVRQSPQYHPEGDVLYHSLQVFELAREHRPYDEEFLLAALLHDIGKGRDADHCVLGAQLATQIGTRLGMWPSDVEMLSKLVFHHLLLAKVAIRLIFFVIAVLLIAAALYYVFMR